VLAALPRSTLTRDQLLAAVRGAAAGLVVSRHGVGQPDLDERRLGILRLLAEGADTREISQSLQYSPSTIKGLIASIESELGSRNRTQAVATAIRRGLI
jgi:DNA-binding NarL/FixJ family response regulator